MKPVESLHESRISEDERETDDLAKSIEEGIVYRRSGVPKGKVLIVFVHGGTDSFFRSRSIRTRNFRGLLARLLAEDVEPFRRADLLPFEYDGHLLSRIRLDDLAERLAYRIQRRFEKADYEAVYLVGHSVGSMVVRQAVLSGYQMMAPGARHWVHAIKRLILLANANRGFEVVRRKNTLSVNVLLFAIDFLEARPLLTWAGLGRLFLSVHRDSPWVKDLRIGWLRRFEGRTGDVEPEAVQIFGTEDQLVGDDDLQEVYQFTKVRTVVLKGFDHASFLTPPFPEVTENLDSTDFLSNYGTIRDSFDRATAPFERITRPAEAPRRVIVFLVHGIRDYADWQENVSYHLRKTFRREQVKDDPGVIATPSSEIEATPSSEIEVVPVRYGYFNAFQFLFPSQRRRSVRAFVDAYYQALARFPYVLVDDIHVMAHSNGTFVLGQALKQHREVRVNRVLLAGSVLPANFDWATLYREGRLREIHSDCRDVDWPVGLLCRGLSWIPGIGIGDGGYDGFTRGQTDQGKASTTFLRNSFLPGGHGAGLTPVNYRHEAIARHLLGVEELPVYPERRRRPWFHVLHVLSNAIVPLGLTAVLALLGAVSGLKGGFNIPSLIGLTLPFWIGWGPAIGFVLAVILIYILSKI